MTLVFGMCVGALVALAGAAFGYWAAKREAGQPQPFAPLSPTGVIVNTEESEHLRERQERPGVYAADG